MLTDTDISSTISNAGENSSHSTPGSSGVPKHPNCLTPPVGTPVFRVQDGERCHQETKWFGEAKYRVGENVVLTAGRPVPAPGEPVQRGEGVAIVLSGPATKAWRLGGKQWKAWSSRLVTACVHMGKKTLTIYMSSRVMPLLEQQPVHKKMTFSKI